MLNSLHRDQRINCYSVAIRIKQSGTVKTVEHSKNDYHSVLSKYRRTGTVETLTRRGRKKSFTNRDRNALKRLVKRNRRLTLQDIYFKAERVQNKDFQPCCIRKDIKEG